MKLVLSCTAASFDALAGVLAAHKIYPGSRICFLKSPAPKLQLLLDSYPRLFPLFADRDFQGNLDLAVLVGPCFSTGLGAFQGLLEQASRIHLYSTHYRDRELLPGAEPYIRPVAAVTTILVEEIRRRRIPLTEREAGLLALGIYESTDALTAPLTTAVDVAAAQHLWETGIDLKILRSRLWPDTGKPPFAEKKAEGAGEAGAEKEKPVVEEAEETEEIIKEKMEIVVEKEKEKEIKKEIEEEAEEEKTIVDPVDGSAPGLPAAENGQPGARPAAGRGKRMVGGEVTEIKERGAGEGAVPEIEPGAGEAAAGTGEGKIGELKVKEDRVAARGEVIAPDLALPEGPAWLEWDSLLPLLTTRVDDRLRGMLLLVGQAAVRRQAEVYLVGGVVRDLLLGREPQEDLDLVVLPEALPLARDLQKRLGGKLITYEQFGTATLFLSGGGRLDLVTARREFYPAPGALPQVEPSALKNDLYRRDFTINSLACSLLPESFGHLFDFFNGRQDLAAGRLRTMYNLSFVDDPLRILRAVRFESRLGFRLEENTMQCMQKAIRGRALERVSRQRIGQEMRNLYREPDPPKVLKRLSLLGVLPFIYPRLQTSPATWRRVEQMARALKLTRYWDWEEPPLAEPAYGAALLYDMEEDSRVVLVSRLYLPRDKSQRILTACNRAPRVLQLLAKGDPCASALVNLLADLPAEALLLVYSLAPEERVRSCLENYVNSLRRVRPRLGGSDLIAMGLSPGPVFQEILQELRKAVLDGRVNTLEEERDLVRAFIEKGV